MELFSVCQYFKDGSYEYVRRNVRPEEAVRAFDHYVASVGARMGLTTRVMIIDQGDCCNAEWVYGQGIVFPPPHDQD
jgi:hypothetical protein